MGPVELFVLLAAVGGTAWIVGTVGWLWHRIKRLEDASLGEGGAPNRLASELREMREALESSDRDLDRLNERLDFLERLLGPGEEDRAEGEVQQ